MSGTETGHQPVMLAEVLATLMPRDDAIYVDATLGGGGYATALLRAAAACRVIGIDRDLGACRAAEAIARRYGDRFVIVHGRFGDLFRLAADVGLARVDGIAFDLGVSSTQLDAAERGFSFRMEGPLDMRMDPGERTTAADAVNRLSHEELAAILYRFGDERASRRIAHAIIRARTAAPILDTRRLADIVRSVLPRSRDGIDPATRTFQALRIWVNDEMGELDRGLAAAERLLAPGGRLVVVAFHSLEDRMVKSFLKLRSGAPPRGSRHRPESGQAPHEPSFRLITRRAVRPTAREIAENHKARSARMRAAERTAAPPWTPPAETRRAA